MTNNFAETRIANSPSRSAPGASGDLLDEGAQTVVGNIALAVRRRVEVHPIDDAAELKVGFGNLNQVSGQLLADLVGQCADDRPDGSLAFAGRTGCRTAPVSYRARRV